MTPLEVQMQYEREYFDDRVREMREHLDKQLDSIEQHRRIVMDLGGIEGIRLEPYRYNLEIDLGDRPRTKRGLRDFGRRLKLVRDTLGQPLRLSHKYLKDEKKHTVRMVLRCDRYPHLQVFYTCKLGRNDRCKVVKKKVRYTDTSLVCEV